MHNLCGDDVPSAAYADLRAWAVVTIACAVELNRQSVGEHDSSKKLPLLDHVSYRLSSFMHNDHAVSFLRSGPRGSRTCRRSGVSRPAPLTGTYTTRIYRALRNGDLLVSIMKVSAKPCKWEAKSQSHTANIGDAIKADDAAAAAAAAALILRQSQPYMLQFDSGRVHSSILGKREWSISICASKSAPEKEGKARACKAPLVKERKGSDV